MEKEEAKLRWLIILGFIKAQNPETLLEIQETVKYLCEYFDLD